MFFNNYGLTRLGAYSWNHFLLKIILGAQMRKFQKRSRPAGLRSIILTSIKRRCAMKRIIEFFLLVVALPLLVAPPVLAFLWDHSESQGRVFWLYQKYINGPSYVTRMTMEGQLEWERVFPVEEMDSPHTLQVSPDGSQILVTCTGGYMGGGDPPGFMILRSQDGTVIVDSRDYPELDSLHYPNDAFWRDSETIMVSDPFFDKGVSRLALISLEEMKILQTWKIEGEMHDPHLSKDGQSVYFVLTDRGQVIKMNLDTGHKEVVLSGADRPRSCILMHDTPVLYPDGHFEAMSGVLAVGNGVWFRGTSGDSLSFLPTRRPDPRWSFVSGLNAVMDDGMLKICFPEQVEWHRLSFGIGGWRLDFVRAEAPPQTTPPEGRWGNIWNETLRQATKAAVRREWLDGHSAIPELEALPYFAD